MDLTDENIGHFLNEVMLPLWHSLLNVDLIPAHVKKCGIHPMLMSFILDGG